jgi:hypothetical protein
MRPERGCSVFARYACLFSCAVRHTTASVPLVLVNSAHRPSRRTPTGARSGQPSLVLPLSSPQRRPLSRGEDKQLDETVIIGALAYLVIRAGDATLNDGRLADAALFMAQHVLRSFGWL